MVRFHLIVAFAVAMLAAGCDSHGDDSCLGETGHSHSDECTECIGGEDPYNATLTGADDNLTIELLEAVPNPHTNGNNVLRVRVTDSTGAARDDVSFTKVEPFAVNQGHGTPLKPIVTPVGSNGEYEIAEINYIHRGTWELRIDVEAGGEADSVVFTFCIAEVEEMS